MSNNQMFAEGIVILSNYGIVCSYLEKNQDGEIFFVKISKEVNLHRDGKKYRDIEYLLCLDWQKQGNFIWKFKL